ncbi:Hypothetical_protein [Hexamita inflata]|uniref:Hypothetical_protein n=1 Tax=Hexamita inflata TaxID=28002 RepID=A0AA86RP29_9EUKA|nr:Hypothetical protein HINF_LOCUS63099 [Hexamita inflata]
MKSRAQKMTIEKERQIVMKVAEMFADKHKDIPIFKEGSFDEYLFFKSYFDTYNLKSDLIKSVNEKKCFIIAMDNFFMEYYTHQLVEQVSAGGNRKEIEKKLKDEAQKYLNYQLFKKLCLQWIDMKITK